MLSKRKSENSSRAVDTVNGDQYDGVRVAFKIIISIYTHTYIIGQFGLGLRPSSSHRLFCVL